MKKILLFTLNFLLFTHIYSQDLHKVQEVKESKKEKINLNISNQPGVPAATLSESFESTTFPPTGWTVFTFGGSAWNRLTVGSDLPGWTNRVTSTPPQGGNAVAYCTWNDTTVFNDQWLITPFIQNIQSTDTLFFWMRNQVEWADSVYIYSSTDGSNFNILGQVFYTAESDTNWGKWFIPIGELIAGSNVYIGFREFVADNFSNGGAISLDLVSISGTNTSNYPSTIQLSKTYSFGDVAQSSSYRLIGIPGNNSALVNTFISGTHKKDWNVFYDNGADTDFLVEFNSQALFNFTPGKGFWALSRNPINVSGQVNSANLTGSFFRISLHNGWNIISNPFEKNVTLADIRNTSNFPNAVIHTYNGNFSQPTTMLPYEGYYIFNDGTHPNLDIPYPFGSSMPKTNEHPYYVSEKSLELKLKSQEFTSEVKIGFDESAKNDYDDLDYFAPPGNFEELNIRLLNDNLSTSYKQLFIEHRPEIGEGQSFELHIKNTTGKSAILNINGIEKFNEDDIYLVDERLKKFYDLKNQNEIEIPGIHSKNEYSLLIGNKRFINSFKDNYTPTEFAIYQNYPNPFNPITFIRYQIPEKTNVSIRVFDILGNLVKVLFDGTEDEGYYEIEFDGSALSSGIYLYEFVSGSVRSIKKMNLVK